MNSSLRIYILGNVDGYFDEAQKNITSRLFNELIQRGYKVKFANAKEELINISFWSKIGRFNPNIIHIFLRPTVFTLLYSKLLRSCVKNAKVIISVFQPPLISSKLTGIIKTLSPDLYLTLSKRLTSYFEALGCRVILLPCGVDVKKFTPVDRYTKKKLRVKYGIPQNKYVILHVGHATRGRNVSVLKSFSGKEIQSVFVASRSFNIEKSITKELSQFGCITFCDYIKNIEELYQLSDCYVFPTVNESNSVSLPLSLLEAMSCNIPVITTKFGAIPELFREDNSFMFFDGTVEDLSIKIKVMINSMPRVSNRCKVLRFDWSYIVKRLEDIYLAI